MSTQTKLLNKSLLTIAAMFVLLSVSVAVVHGLFPGYLTAHYDAVMSMMEFGNQGASG